MKPAYPETADLILEALPEDVVPRIRVAELRRFHRHTPPENAPKIAKILTNKIRKMQEPSSLRVITKRNFLDSSKRRQLEIQRYRCCYDHYEMLLEKEFHSHPRYATWEHVIRAADGGTNYKDNVALACRICNNLRDTFGMSAEEFSEWALSNKDEIEKRAEHSNKLLLNRKKQSPGKRARKRQRSIIPNA